MGSEFHERIVEKFKSGIHWENFLDAAYKANNLFFYANACHVCKLENCELPFSSVKRCSRCKMISYCNKKHQKQHWPEHKELCDVICKILQETKKSRFFMNSTGLETNAWMREKTRVLKFVQSKMNKKMLPYEEQMFKFPRNCIVCHETNPDVLSDCKSCLSASFCKNHENDPKHNEHCPSFAFYHKVNSVLLICSLFFSPLDFFEKALGISVMKVVPYHFEDPHLPKSMKHYIQAHVKKSLRLDSVFVSSFEGMAGNLQEIYISEYFTNPLTLLYAMERLDFPSESEIVIHVMGAKMESEVEGAAFWEILLHRLPRLCSLKIVFIGQELSQKKLTYKICDRCSAKNKTLSMEVYKSLYNVYCKGKDFVRPNIVVGYNLGLHKYTQNLSTDTWKDSVVALTKHSCPVVLTSTCDYKAQQIHKIIRRLIGNSTTYSCYERNPFASLRLNRDFETDGLVNNNRYIITYPMLIFTANKDRSYKDLKCSRCKDFICYVDVKFGDSTSLPLCSFCSKELDLSPKDSSPISKVPVTLCSKLATEYDTLIKENRQLKEQIELLTIELEELQNTNKKNTSDEMLAAKLNRVRNFFSRNVKELKQVYESRLNK